MCFTDLSRENVEVVESYSLAGNYRWLMLVRTEAFAKYLTEYVKHNLL